MNHSMYASPHVASTLLNLGSLWPYFTHEMETREAVSAHASSLRECNSCYVCDTVNP